MATTIRPTVSSKNKYWIDRHRYYELKHFCLQYPVWRDKYVSISELSSRPLDKEKLHISDISDTTAKLALVRTKYRDLMELVESTARETDQELASYIVKAVTEGYTYETLKFKFKIPCCREVYYNLYRRFFWLLSEKRG